MVEAAVTRASAGGTPGKPADTSDALEDALAQLGPFGFYQGYILVMLCIPNLLAVMYSLNYVFVADQVPFRCVVPECERGEVLFDNEAAQALLPAEQCRRYEPLDHTAQCDREHFHINDTMACDKFVYQTQDTIFAEFDLGCRDWMRTLVGSVRNAALPVALVLTGYTSDTFGRRTAFCIFSAFAGVMGIVKAFSLNYYMYLVLEFLEAALGYGFNSAGYVLMVEMAHPSLRAVFACATGVAYGLGGVLFAWVAYGVPYWRHLLWTIHSLALLLPLYYMLLDESPRWLHAKGNVAKTDAVIRKAAAWNKVVVDEEVMQRLGESVKVEGEALKESPWRSVVRSRVLLLRFAVCCWCWAATAFVYYGLTINSVSLSGNKHVNFALNMSMEIAASVLIMMALERIGRRMCIFLAFLLCGVACVSPFFVTHPGTLLGLFFVGKLAITFAFNSLYVFTAELYPTHARSSALAACSLVGRLGSVLAPQTPLLSLSVQAVLYGVCTCSAALAILLTPETRRARLPQRVADAERMRTDAERLDDALAHRPPAPPPRYLSADS
ncbi:organic cation transporter protein-like [Anticarsia gemmatalis]|uniref:organic cation transporter protein-like n=1 Tax=Anticarsia gemmatalis TaxID=129554 RepID=UPI003F767D80